MFNSHYYSEFESDEAVVHHELGHAFVWLKEGGIVDQISFWRTSDNLLAGKMTQGLPALRPGETVEMQLERMWKENGPQFVRRLLAGEAAARRYLDLPENEIFCEFSINANDDLMSLLQSCGPGSSDIVKALHNAYDNVGDDWPNWIANRHCEARRQINDLWEGLTAYAGEILQRIPARPGDPLVIPLIDLNIALAACTASES